MIVGTRCCTSRNSTYISCGIGAYLHDLCYHMRIALIHKTQRLTTLSSALAFIYSLCVLACCRPWILRIYRARRRNELVSVKSYFILNLGKITSFLALSRALLKKV